jgi:XTP/dITP diphosphohydrolase
MERMMPKLQLASYNKGKLKELKALLKDLRVDLVTPEDLELYIDVAEVGNSYAENAAIKAQTFSQNTNLLTLADDSGLEVEVLDNAPGMYSARYNPKPGASDADRRNYLLEQLQKYQRPWIARFHCTVAIAEPGGKVHFTEGICEGEVIPEERGTYGFGYDPIFFIPETGQTMAELNMEEKNLVSHRSKAVRKAIPIILELIG